MHLLEANALALQVVTVDASQGSEAPHIILSTVRTTREQPVLCWETKTCIFNEI